MIFPIVLLLVSSFLRFHETTAAGFADLAEFSADYFKNIDPGPDKNYVASGSNVKAVLYVLQRGSKGKTHDELEKVFKLPKDQEKADSLAHKYLTTMNAENYQVVRAIYVTDQVAIDPDFQKLAKESYESQLVPVDFSYKGVAELVNMQSRELSGDYTVRPIKPEDVGKSTKMVCVAGLVYIDEWTVQFPPELTSFKPFKRQTGPVNVLTMNHPNARVKFANVEGLQVEVLKLDFKNQNPPHSWWVVLPNQGVDVNSIPALLPQLIDVEFSEKSVNISLPKFQIDNLLDTQGALQELGVNEIFDHSKADLSGIGGKPGDIYLDKIVQKTEIRINEAGLQQAPLNDKVNVEDGKAEVEFNVNRPFYFFLFKEEAVMVGGKVVDPLEFS